MKIFTSMQQYVKPDKPIVTALGNFDGVHLGHQKLIKTAKEIAEKIKGETLVFTFFPHPQMLFNANIKMLNSFKTKLQLIESLGVENVLIIPFTREFSLISPQVFVEEILIKKIQTSHVVAGFNYSFGYKGMGNADMLINLAAPRNVKVTIMEPFYVDNELVSSTKIREYLKEGNIKEAEKLLGYQPAISGKVIEGNKIGRKIGFPTANLEWDSDLLIPGNGVYVVKVLVDNKKYLGVLNIGNKPTVNSQPLLSMEVYLLNFSGDLYHKEIEI
ncbi:MAG: riboflavin biosynthesis protein RibF, partial [Clostridia bacterium]|nr:riboflavin biosynthesis protein RibF [Clostridia bacterium]